MNDTAKIATERIKNRFTYTGALMLALDAEYPRIQTKEDSLPKKRINRVFWRWARDFSRYAKNKLFEEAVADFESAKANGFPFRPYEATMRYQPTLNRDCTLSVTTDQYEYAGGAHGSTVRYSASFDLRTGRRIRLRDLFARGDAWRRIVLEQVLRQADRRAQAEPGVFFDDYRTLIIQHFHPENFFLTPHGVGVYYQQYEIAPYASGIVVFETPYEALGVRPPGCGA